MDINKGKLVYIKNKSSYNSNVFLDTLVIFVEDTKEIITHGISFAGIPSSYNMYVGAKDKKANASTTNGNTYIKLYKDSTLNNQFLIKGTGATTVVSDASGNITINSTDNNTWRALQVKGTQIAGTGTSTYPINFAEGTDITLTGTAGTSTTKLNSITINHASISTTVTAAKDTATLLAYSGEITVPTAITTNNGHITAYTWTKYKLPAASHYTTKIYTGSSLATANSTSDVSNPYLTVVDDTTYRNQVQFKGGGKTTIKANGGIITISSTDTWNAFVGATSSKAGTAGYVPAPNSGQTGLYFRSDGTWATPPGTYSLPTASNTTLGGVKTGAAITDISGYTAVHIKDGVIYYKNTTYSTKALKINGNTYNVYTSNASLPTIYAPTAVGTAGQVLATNSNADGLEWKSVATTTKSMKINGNNYSIYTTGTSLPTIYAPTALGTAGQVLKMNSDGTALIWATDATIANAWRPVQALKSDGTSLGTLNDSTSTVKFKAGSNITLAYSSGTITITGVGDTWTALGGATASADGTAGYAPKPTKGQQGYYLKGNATWVKPSLSEFTDDVVAGNYLPLSGGTLLVKSLNGFTVKMDQSSVMSAIAFANTSRILGYIALNSGGPIYRTSSGTNYGLYHTGNFTPSDYLLASNYTASDILTKLLTVDGADSGLDADLLDGVHLSTDQKPYGKIPLIGADGVMEVGKYIDFHNDNTTGSDFSTRLICSGEHSNNVSLPSTSGTLALTTSNVASATKLQTARKIWGLSFNGSSDITGDLTISNNKFIYTKHSDGTSLNTVYTSTDNVMVFGYGAATKSISSCLDGFDVFLRYGTGHNIGFTLNSTGNVGVGTTDPSTKFHVNGTGRFDDKLTINYNNKGTDTYALVINRNNYGDTIGIFNTANANDLFIRGSVSFPNRSDANGGNGGMGWHVFPASSGYVSGLSTSKASYNISTGSVTFGEWNDTEMPLYIDIINKRVGIGTVSPSVSFKLHVAGSAGVTGSLLFIKNATTYLLADITTDDTTGFLFEAPRKTNSSSGDYLPYTFSWRGGWNSYYGILFIRETGGTYINIKSLDSAMKLFAWGGATYMQSGNKDFSGNYPLYITGPSATTGSDLWLNFSNIMCGANKYTLYHSGNHKPNGEFVYNIEGTDFEPDTKDGTYIGMSTLTGIEENWRHVVSMNWSQAGDTAGNATWCSLLSLPTLNKKGIYYRSATGEKTWGPWVKLLDSTDSVGGGSSFNGEWTGTFLVNGSNSRGSYPSVKWHIPNINWAQILMNGAGELEFRGGGGVLDAGYSNVRMGILVCTSLQINGQTLTFVT